MLFIHSFIRYCLLLIRHLCYKTIALSTGMNIQCTRYCSKANTRSVAACPASLVEAARGCNKQPCCMCNAFSLFFAYNLCIVWQCVQARDACTYRGRQLPAAKYQEGKLNKRAV